MFSVVVAAHEIFSQIFAVFFRGTCLVSTCKILHDSAMTYKILLISRLKDFTYLSSWPSLIIVQWCALENQQTPFYVVNEVTLTGQNLSL